MKIQANVKSTAEVIPVVDVNKDTVYQRADVTEIEDEHGNNLKNIGIEIQYDIREYIEGLSNTDDVQIASMLIALLMGEVDTLRMRVETLEGGFK